MGTALKVAVPEMLLPARGMLIALAIASGALHPNCAAAQTAGTTSGATISPQEAANAKAAWDRGDYEAAFPVFHKLAERGNVEAEATLGFMYRFALGVPRDYAKAAGWLKKPAEQGIALAQAELGFIYLSGEGVPIDYTEAMVWLRKAVSQNNAQAEFYLGEVYATGKGVEKDYGQAVAWFAKAAAQDDSNAETKLGDMYYGGLGVSKDYAKALEWFTKAAEQGDVDAQAFAGYMYEKGQGTRPNREAAIGWFKKAAAQGDADSQKELNKLQHPTRHVDLSALRFRCWLESMKLGKPAVSPANEAEAGRVHQFFQKCLRSNWHRLFGDAPFPED